MNSKVYRWCGVPQCENTSIKTPNKLFVFVPQNKTIRNKWLKLARRDSKGILPSTHLYFCEDHFDLPNDMDNYMEYYLMGSVSQIRMKPGCMPTKFQCQSDRRKRTSDATERPYILKKQGKTLIEECQKDLEETTTKQLELEEMPSGSSETEMSKGKVNNKVIAGKVLNFDHLIFWVANAKTAASYFVTRFGFKPLAVREPSDGRRVVSHAVRLNLITIVFESPTAAGGALAKDLAAHGDFVKDVAFEVESLDELVRRAKEGGAVLVKDITEDKDEDGLVRYAVLRTYGDNTHTLIDRTKYKGLFLPGFKAVEDDPLSEVLPNTDLMFIDHVEGNMADGTLEDSVSWYEKNLNMHRFWCVDYNHDLVPYSCINSASVINKNETVLLSMNEAAKGLKPTSKASEFVKALGSSGVEHVALYTDDIVATMRNLKARGAEILVFPPTYYDIIKEKLEGSSLKVTESIDALKEFSILIDFDERGYMLQAFTKHVQARPTLFIEVLQRRNHRGFGAMNYKWVFEAIELLEASSGNEKEKKDKTEENIKNDVVIKAEA